MPPRLSKLDAARETRKNANLPPPSCASLRHAKPHRDKPPLAHRDPAHLDVRTPVIAPREPLLCRALDTLHEDARRRATSLPRANARCWSERERSDLSEGGAVDSIIDCKAQVAPVRQGP